MIYITFRYLKVKIGERWKGKRSDSVLWQKPLHRQKKSKKQRDNTKTPPKTSITQRMGTDLGQG